MAQNQKPPFSADEMRDELRTILLFSADFLAMARNSAAAAAFMGFESEQYHREPVDRVMLDLFQIAPTMDVMFDYAFQVGAAHRFSEDQLQDANVFMEGAPRAGGQGVEGGETHPFMGLDGLCRRTVDTAHARWKLENQFRSDLTVRELALLANMTEGAVRNALAGAGIKAKGSRTYVDVDFAKEWLNGRRGFVPTTCWVYSPERAMLDIRTASSAYSLARALSGRAEEKGLSPEALSRSAGIPADKVSAWLAGHIDLDIRTATSLAAALDLDPATVAGRSVELALRAETQSPSRRTIMFETCIFTRHARERTTARAIPPLVVEMIMEFGESCDADSGARKYALSKKSMRLLRRFAGPKVADEINRFRARNAYVVAAADRVVTAAYSSKPLFR